MLNLFFIAFLAIVIGAVIAVLITRKSTPTRDTMLLPEDDALSERPEEREGAPLDMGRLFALAERLCGERGLEITEKVTNTPSDVYWIAKHSDPFFFGNYVFGFLQTTESHPLVTLSDVLNFKDFVKGAGSTKGFLLTTGYFSRDVHQPLEGPNVTLFNRRRVLEERRARNL